MRRGEQRLRRRRLKKTGKSRSPPKRIARRSGWKWWKRWGAYQ
jgi:hypothetical protein